MKLAEDTQTGTVPSPPSCCRLGRNNEDTEIQGGRRRTFRLGDGWERGFQSEPHRRRVGWRKKGLGRTSGPAEASGLVQEPVPAGGGASFCSSAFLLQLMFSAAAGGQRQVRLELCW